MNSIADGIISWELESSYTSDSNDEIEQWHNRLHEVTTLNCNMMVILLRHVVREARELPIDTGATNMEELIDHCDKAILEQKQLGAQTETLCETTAQGWRTHQ